MRWKSVSNSNTKQTLKRTTITYRGKLSKSSAKFSFWNFQLINHMQTHTHYTPYYAYIKMVIVHTLFSLHCIHSTAFDHFSVIKSIECWFSIKSNTRVILGVDDFKCWNTCMLKSNGLPSSIMHAHKCKCFFLLLSIHIYTYILEFYAAFNQRVAQENFRISNEAFARKLENQTPFYISLIANIGVNFRANHEHIYKLLRCRHRQEKQQHRSHWMLFILSFASSMFHNVYWKIAFSQMIWKILFANWACIFMLHWFLLHS